MASIINSTTTSPGGLISTGDSSNSLLIQTGDTTAITVNSSQQVALTNPLALTSGGTGANSASGARTNLGLVLGTSANNVPQFDSSGWLVLGAGWKVKESGGVLYFAVGATNYMKLDASGNLTVAGNVTAYGTV